MQICLSGGQRFLKSLPDIPIFASFIGLQGIEAQSSAQQPEFTKYYGESSRVQLSWIMHKQLCQNWMLHLKSWISILGYDLCNRMQLWMTRRLQDHVRSPFIFKKNLPKEFKMYTDKDILIRHKWRFRIAVKLSIQQKHASKYWRFENKQEI